MFYKTNKFQVTALEVSREKTVLRPTTLAAVALAERALI